MNLIVTCPNDPQHDEFCTVQTVLEEVVVDSAGEFVDRLDFLELVHGPDPENVFTCRVCRVDAIVTEESAG